MAKRKWTDRDGESRTALYAVWRTMHSRCYTPTHNRFARYGGRGITVCDEWHDWEAFRNWAHGSGYKQGRQIDRIDTDGPYSPSNCRWVSSKENNRNRSNNRLVTWRGQTKTLADWADDRRCCVTYRELHDRLSKGWEFERSMTQPLRRKGGYRMITAWGEEKALSEWLDDPRSGVFLKGATLWKRINDGWVPERAISSPVRQR